MIDSNNIIYRKLSVTIHIVVLFNRLISGGGGFSRSSRVVGTCNFWVVNKPMEKRMSAPRLVGAFTYDVSQNLGFPDPSPPPSESVRFSRPPPPL